VDRLRAGKRLGLKVRIGAPDPSLTGVSGMAAVTELCDQLDVVGALDGAVGPIKQRAVGHSAGQLLVGLAAAQLAGQDHLVGLDRLSIPSNCGDLGCSDVEWVVGLVEPACGVWQAGACPRFPA
jgi:hypothetical protein